MPRVRINGWRTAAQRRGWTHGPLPVPPPNTYEHIKTPHLDTAVAQLDAAYPLGAVPDPQPGDTSHLPTFGRAPKRGPWR